MEKYNAEKVRKYEAERDYRGLFVYVLRLSRFNSSARLKLAQCFENGWGCQQDFAQAVERYQRLVDKGNTNAMVHLAICYKYGKGVEKDVYRAIELYRAAACQGNATALNNLGICYEYGTGVEQNMDKALYFDILHRISYLFSYQPSNIKPEYKKLGEYINQKNATCITFNYDLLLEKLLNDTFTFRVALTDKNIVSDSYKYHYRMPLTTFDAKDYLKTDSYDYPEILKLHGSINWI